MIEKFTRSDIRLMAMWFCIGIISLIIVQTSFTKVFPDASIKMDVNKEQAQVKAKAFLANRGHDISEYMHGQRFGYRNDAKEFLEFELSPDSAGAILNNTNSYFWKHKLL